MFFLDIQFFLGIQCFSATIYSRRATFRTNFTEFCSILLNLRLCRTTPQFGSCFVAIFQMILALHGTSWQFCNFRRSAPTDYLNQVKFFRLNRVQNSKSRRFLYQPPPSHPPPFASFPLLPVAVHLKPLQKLLRTNASP